MKIEEQVCTLEQAKKLKKLKLSQDSYFQWKCNNVQNVVVEKTMTDMIDRSLPTLNKNYAAFTVSELGVMLPIEVKNAYLNYRFDHMGDYHVQYMIDNKEEQDLVLVHNDFLVWKTSNISEAQARATMLIYLLENNLITSEEVNNRLNKQ